VRRDMRIDSERDEGVSLVEVLITCFLTVIVMAAIGSLMVSLFATPRTVTSRMTAANTAQTAARSIDLGIRNSSDFLLTSPVGNDQLLVARTAQSGSTISWVCSAWYYSATEATIRYTSSTTAIPAVPTSTALASWTVLDASVTPTSGTSIFSASGPKVSVSFKGAATGQTIPQSMTFSVLSRAGSTGSPACY